LLAFGGVPFAISVVILCGGRGTRLRQEASAIPKPLVEIGDRPILWHVMQVYIAQGVRRFVLCAGHRCELIERFVTSERWPDGVDVECVDTGEDTPTGGRIWMVRDHLGQQPFFATYGDGLADIDLEELVAHHRDHGRIATVTAVRPDLPFGVLEFAGDGRVAAFHEKPRSEHWINGGFFCFEPGVFEYLQASSVLEREPLEGLAADGQLTAYRHTGFWECLDTYKDAAALNDMWSQGRAPWKVWRERCPNL
jgi:glucose-1-phosphate cytidylyltransferase